MWLSNHTPINPSHMSLSICSTNSSQPSLNLTIAKNHHQSSRISLAIVADFNIPISLWTSKPFKPSTKTMRLTDDETLSNLLVNFIEEILHYGTNKHSIPYIKFPKLDSVSNFQDIFNLAFLTLLFLVCIDEAPSDLRSGCLSTLKEQLAGFNQGKHQNFWWNSWFPTWLRHDRTVGFHFNRI